MTALRTVWPEVGFGGFLELAQHHRRDFRRRELLAVDVDLHEVVRPADDLVRDELLLALHLVVPAAHEPLDRVDRALRIGDGLPLGRIADEPVALVGERDDARRQPVAFLVGDDLDLAAFHDGDDRVRGAEVDADDFLFSHGVISCF